jgi:hypothetical protein
VRRSNPYNTIDTYDGDDGGNANGNGNGDFVTGDDWSDDDMDSEMLDILQVRLAANAFATFFFCSANAFVTFCCVLCVCAW